MWLLDQRVSPSSRLVTARHTDEGFQEAENVMPMLWAVVAQDGAAVHPGKFYGNLSLAHASKAVGRSLLGDLSQALRGYSSLAFPDENSGVGLFLLQQL